MTQRPDNVRFAKPSDEGELMRMMHSMHHENAQATMCEDKVRAMLQSAITRPTAAQTHHCMIGVIEGSDGALAGSIGLGLAQWWYSDDWHVEELWNFVNPDYRRVPGTSNAGSLIQFGKWFAENMALPFLIGVLSTVRTEAKIRFYAKHQLPHVGAFFLYHNKGALQ